MQAADHDVRPEPDWDRLVTGALLVGLGVVWLLSTAEVVDPDWRVLLPSALMAVGALIVLLAVRGRSNDLVGTGVLLTVLVLLGGIFPASPTWRFGDQEVRPATATELEARYSHGIGTLTVDLREIDLETDLDVEASNGIGELVVHVPADATLHVEARVGVGTAAVGDREASGFNARLDTQVAGEGPTIRLDLSAGIGEIRVER